MTKTWFITGAARGLGAEIVNAALAAGDNIVATARAGSSAFANMENAGDRLLALSLDVTKASSIQVAVNTAVEKFGRIDVLVNNAGYGHLGIFEESTDEDVRNQFETNVFGLMAVTRAVLPIMRKQRSGNILNMSSIGGIAGFDSCTVYGASKYAVEGFSVNLAKDVSQFGISVTAVAPGYFRTDFLEPQSIRFGSKKISDYQAAAETQAAYEGYTKHQPGDPAKLARALVELVNAEKVPIQLLLGTDAVQLAEQAFAARDAEMAKWRSVSLSTDIDA